MDSEDSVGTLSLDIVPPLLVHGVEHAAQHWVDYGDATRGVALLNFGLPGNLISGDTLLLSLMRSHNLGGYGYGGGYEPGMSSESGFQLGKPLTNPRSGLLKPALCLHERTAVVPEVA